MIWLLIQLLLVLVITIAALSLAQQMPFGSPATKWLVRVIIVAIGVLIALSVSGITGPAGWVPTPWHRA